ncbi:MAG: STAS domain-containing protein [Lachnospiraceae bacterium]|nr:STAS domain-containing protein [Lachnospiraceae bacterium]
MEIIKTAEEGKMNIELKGRLDTTTAPELEKEISDVIEDITDITLDLKELEYISSAGLRVLLATQKAMNRKEGTMVVKEVPEVIMEIFEVTGFSDILTIE